MDGSFDAFIAMGTHLRGWIEHNAQGEAVPAGEVFIEEGSSEARLWLLESGRALVSTSGPGGHDVHLAGLEPGGLVGEMSVLEGRPAVASVIAGSDCRAIRINTLALEREMQGNLWLAHDVNALFARKLARQLAAQNSYIHRWPDIPIEPLRKALVVFAELSEIDVAWLATMGERRHHPDQSVLIRQGELVPDLLLLLVGKALVHVNSPAGPINVGSSRAGELLGEMSLLGSDERASATVIADGPIDVLALPKPQLLERLQSDPGLGSRFYRAMALLLSQRNRDQLLSRGLAAISMQTEMQQATRGTDRSSRRSLLESELETEERLSLDQMASISKAGQRFHWLCQSIGVPITS